MDDNRDRSRKKGRVLAYWPRLSKVLLIHGIFVYDELARGALVFIA